MLKMNLFVHYNLRKYNLSLLLKQRFFPNLDKQKNSVCFRGELISYENIKNGIIQHIYILCQ